MTATEGRLHTLKSLQDWVKSQMDSCEGEDNWVFLGSFPDQAAKDALFFEEPVKIIRGIGNDVECIGASGRQVTVHMNYLENRKHLDTSRYNAFKEMYDKIEELITKTANSPANI